MHGYFSLRGGKMAPVIADPYQRDYQDSPVNDLIVFTKHAADKGATHIAFQGPLAEYITPPPKLREIADALDVVREAASGHDADRMAEQKSLMETVIKALDHNSFH